MYNRIDRFIRKSETILSPDVSALEIETAVYVPERVSSKDSVPWKTIYSRLSGYAVDPLEREIHITYDTEIAEEQQEAAYPISGKLKQYGREQMFAVSADAGLTGTISLEMPAAEVEKTGDLVLYLEEKPSAGEGAGRYYTFTGDNIKSWPRSKPWLSASKGDAVWKFEFESVPGNDKWYFLQATKY